MRAITAVMPCSNLDATQRFYERLELKLAADHGDYRILYGEAGVELHLRQAENGSLPQDENPFGLYFHVDDVDAMAERMAGLVEHPAKHQPWGMYELALSDPDGALVRVGQRSTTR